MTFAFSLFQDVTTTLKSILDIWLNQKHFLKGEWLYFSYMSTVFPKSLAFVNKLLEKAMEPFLWP